MAVKNHPLSLQQIRLDTLAGFGTIVWKEVMMSPIDAYYNFADDLDSAVDAFVREWQAHGSCLDVLENTPLDIRAEIFMRMHCTEDFAYNKWFQRTGILILLKAWSPLPKGHAYPGLDWCELRMSRKDLEGARKIAESGLPSVYERILPNGWGHDFYSFFHDFAPCGFMIYTILDCEDFLKGGINRYDSVGDTAGQTLAGGLIYDSFLGITGRGFESHEYSQYLQEARLATLCLSQLGEDVNLLSKDESRLSALGSSIGLGYKYKWVLEDDERAFQISKCRDWEYIELLLSLGADPYLSCTPLEIAPIEVIEQENPRLYDRIKAGEFDRIDRERYVAERMQELVRDLEGYYSEQ